ALRVGEHLPVLAREDLRDLLLPVVYELANPEEEIRPLRERERTPGREGLLRRLDGRVDFLDAREVDGPRLLPRRGVVDRAAATRLAGDAAPADPVVDPLDPGARVPRRRCQFRHLI